MQLRQCTKDNKILPMVREYIATEGSGFVNFQGDCFNRLVSQSEQQVTIGHTMGPVLGRTP